MTASELNRKLLFCGYDEVTDYLKNSPLNRYLYKMFIDILPKHLIEVPIVVLFNEIYYQCVRVNYDGNPGVDVEGRYIDEEFEWVKCDKSTQLIFCVVYTLLKAKRNLTFHEECFLFRLTSYVKASKFAELADSISSDLRVLEIKIPEVFPTMMYDRYDLPLMSEEEMHSILENRYIHPWYEAEERERREKEVQDYFNTWRIITNNYSHYTIEKYLKLFPNPNDQVQVFHIIQLSCRIFNGNLSMDYNMRLESSIKTGNFEPQDKFFASCDTPMGLAPDEYDEYRHNLALDREATDEELNKTEQLQRDCDALRSQLEEQRKMHEMELSRIVAKYSAQIEELEAKLGKLPALLPAANERKDENNENTDQELSFTVAEMATFAMQQFNRAGGVDFTNMFYQLARKHNRIEERSCSMVDMIVPAILRREAPHQTINIPTVQQLNINPQNVINQPTDDNETIDPEPQT